jgi:hypothetical protein
MSANSTSPQQIPAARKREIAGLAEAISTEYFPSVSKIEPEFILKQKRITFSYGHYAEAFDGLLEHLEGRFHVYCNLDRVESANSPRARFTLAHEIGHFFIDEHRNALESGLAPSHASVCEYESKNPVEQEADHFASNLLMPTSKFKARAARVQRGLPGVLTLANEFGTSVTSTAIRYMQVEPIPGAVFKWNDKGLSWSWVSDTIMAARWGSRVNRLDDLPIDSATRQALRNEILPDKPFLENGSTAATWFRRVAADGCRNEILVEQAIKLGRFGVLTFVFPASGRIDSSVMFDRT